MHTGFLQEKLNKRGDVYVSAGEYSISKPLVIYDNTRLILEMNAVIKLADGANCVMLKNSLCRAGENCNITVEGGTWDGNNLAQKRGKQEDGKPYYMGMALLFDGVRNLTIRNITIKNPNAYAMTLKGVKDFTVENVTFDFNLRTLNMDGVHVQGPAQNGYIHNIKGATNDDMVALNCDDGYDDGEKSIVSQGDIKNIVIDGVFAENGYTGIRLLSCGSKMTNISIRNIFGTYRFYGISFTHHDIIAGAPVWFDNIDVTNVYCSKPPRESIKDTACIETLDNFYGKGTHDWAVGSAPIIWFAEGIVCGTVSISNLHRDEYAETKAYTVQIEKNVKIEKLTIKNATQRWHKDEEQPLIWNEGQVDIFEQKD